MRNIPDYDLERPSTWVVIPKREAISEFDEGRFQGKLIEIAGVNIFGKPNLVLRWGADYRDPMLLDDKPKYYVSSNDPVLIGRGYRDDDGFHAVDKIEDVPIDKIYIPLYSEMHLGERRFIVEIWRSAEFLKRSGRYLQTSDPGHTTTYFECRNCGQHVPVAPETMNLDIERRCMSCDSKRVSPVDLRERESGALTCGLPPEGCYDYFYRIERADGTYHPPDDEALAGIELLWREHQKSFKQKDREIKSIRAKAAKIAKQQRHEIWAQ